MSIAEAVIQKLLALPADKQENVLAYVEELERQFADDTRQALFDPAGVAASVGCDLTIEDFRANRRAMWGTGSDEELE